MNIQYLTINELEKEFIHFNRSFKLIVKDIKVLENLNKLNIAYCGKGFKQYVFLILEKYNNLYIYYDNQKFYYTVNRILYEELPYPEITILTQFKTQQDVWEYLIEGGRVQNKTYIVRFKYKTLVKQHKITKLITPSHFVFDVADEWKPYIEHDIPWYFNIPKQGIICWIDKNKNNITLITEYIQGVGDEFYNNLIPLTKEELNLFNPRSLDEL